MNFFEIKISGNQGRRDSYFIMPQLDNLKFKENYQEREISNYVYIELSNEAKLIEFSTTEDISFLELPVFISPSISELPIVSINISESEEKFSKQSIIALAIILAFLIGFIVYIIIQVWYKRKYEDYLFKNKNNLYNIVSYVKSAKSKGSTDKEIRAKLKKAGWTSEQIRYVMRKYSGKRTGMFEIPVGKILDIFKKRKPQSKSQKNVQPFHPPNKR